MKLKTVILSLFLLLGTSVFAGNSDICIFFPDGEERGGLYYLTGQDNPFTGTSKCVYSDTGQIEYLGEIRNGKLEGVWTKWLWFFPFALILAYAIYRIKRHRTSSNKTSD